MKTSIAFIFLLLSITNLYSQSAADQKFRLADSYEKSGDIQNAARLYEELHKELPNNQIFFDALTRTFMNLNRYSELLVYARDKYEKTKDVNTSILYAELLWRTGTTSEANKVWEKAISDFGKNGEVYQKISNSQVQLRLFDKAIAVLLQGRKSLGDPKLFSDALSRLYIAVGDFVKGTSEVLLLLSSDWNLAIAQGRIYALNIDEKAQSHIQKELKSFAENNSENIVAQELYAWFLRTIQRLDQALDVYKNIDRLKRSNGADLIRFGEDSRRDEQYDIALKAFGIVMDMGKSNPYIHSALYGYARTLEQKILQNKKINPDDANEMIKRYRNIIKDFPNSQQATESRLRIAAIAVNFLNDIPTAIEELQTVVKERPMTHLAASASLELADIHIYQEKFEAAEIILKDVSAKYKNNLQNFANKAKLMTAEIVFYKGMIDSSLSLFAELSIVPETDIANSALGKIVLIEQNKQFVQGLAKYARAEYLERRKDIQGAVKLLDEVISITGGNDLSELAFKKKAELEQSLGSFDAAIATVDKLLAEIPDTIYGDVALLIKSDCLVSIGKKEDAIATLTEILVKYPRSIYLNDVREKIRKLRDERS